MTQNADEPRSEQLLEPARIAPQTEPNAPDEGTKLFVVFFLLIVPPLGLLILAAICWKLWKIIMAEA